MPKFKVPAGVSSVAHASYSFVADEDGFIDTADAPGFVIEHLTKFAGVTLATDADIEKADIATVKADVELDAKTEKAQLTAQLKQRGIAVDGRATIKKPAQAAGGVRQRRPGRQGRDGQSCRRQSCGRKKRRPKKRRPKKTAEKSAEPAKA